MIECKLINNAEYGLQERERLSASLYMDEAAPHVLLSTCNRTELYWGKGDVPEHIVRHLFRVASGLESSLVGERAIQGQLKQAYQEASGKYKLPAQLHRLFQSAIHTGKRVRVETRISEGAISHSQATADMIRREDIDLESKIVSIIGVNKLTEDVLKFLVSRRAINIFLSNRNFEKAQSVARQYNGTAIRLDNKDLMLKSTDILICATSAPHLIIKKEDIPAGKSMLIFDLAFPRDVEAGVGAMENVKLFNLEDIERFAKDNLALRLKEIGKAEKIISEEIAKFCQWQYVKKNKVLVYEQE
jgi:glutamyl-tRNA reductase